MRQLLVQLDEFSARIERVTVLVLLSVMALTVFFDVVLRVASGPEGLILSVLSSIFVGGPLSLEELEAATWLRVVVGVLVVLATWTTYSVLRGDRFGFGRLKALVAAIVAGVVARFVLPVIVALLVFLLGKVRLAAMSLGEERLVGVLRMAVPIIVGLLALLFYYGALRTARGLELAPGKALQGAIGLLVGSILLLLGVMWIFPNGLVWSQPLALALLLWVALFGATLVTRVRGHIALEVADKLWPKAALPYARLLSGITAALFCLMVAVLGVHYVESSFGLWWNDGVGYLPGIRIPEFIKLAAIPVAFFLMGVRFLAYSIADWGKPPPAPEMPGIPQEIEVKS